MPPENAPRTCGRISRTSSALRPLRRFLRACSRIPPASTAAPLLAGPNVTLSEAQIANRLDLNLDKLDLKPGMTLLEIGCGWGLTPQRAMEKYDVNVIGFDAVEEPAGLLPRTAREGRQRPDLRCPVGWPTVPLPVDRIVSIEAFEHFGFLSGMTTSSRTVSTSFPTTAV